jgi:hypothetical protein
MRALVDLFNIRIGPLAFASLVQVMDFLCRAIAQVFIHDVFADQENFCLDGPGIRIQGFIALISRDAANVALIFQNPKTYFRDLMSSLVRRPREVLLLRPGFDPLGV